MNKLELIKNLMEECQLKKKESTAMVDLFFSKINVFKNGMVSGREGP